MARIPRKKQKVFAAGASNNGVFGSAQDGTKVLSNDLDTLQSKAAFNTGWNDAVLGNKKFPPLEEFQALDYINTTQLAYIFQEGIPEYDSTTTYFQKSIVKQAGTYNLYGSLTDNNTGNALGDATKWQFLIALDGTIGNATEIAAGIARIATAAEVKAATDDTLIVTPLKLKAFGFQTADGKDHWSAFLQDAWIWADGNTIGNASSNATNRANADTFDLFKVLWRDYSDAVQPIYTSAGILSTRGASPEADFAANKQIKVIDKRGRVSAGRDSMGGTPAGRLTGQPNGVTGTIIGSGGGLETGTLGTGNLPNFSLSFSTWTQAGGSQDGSKPLAALGSGSTVVGTTTTSSIGSGAAFNNVQPTIVCNYIIKL